MKKNKKNKIARVTNTRADNGSFAGIAWHVTRYQMWLRGGHTYINRLERERRKAWAAEEVEAEAYQASAEEMSFDWLSDDIKEDD